MVKTSQNRLRLDAAIVGNLVALRGRLRNRFERQRNARPKALVRAAVIVMRDPLKERAFQVVLGKRNQEVQALLPGRTHNPFAIRIGVCRLLHLKLTLQDDVFAYAIHSGERASALFRRRAAGHAAHLAADGIFGRHGREFGREPVGLERQSIQDARYRRKAGQEA